jgi:hypothetical protein
MYSTGFESSETNKRRYVFHIASETEDNPSTKHPMQYVLVAITNSTKQRISSPAIFFKALLFMNN